MKKNRHKDKCIFYDDFIYYLRGKEAVQTCLAIVKKLLPHKPNNWLCCPRWQQLQQQSA